VKVSRDLINANSCLQREKEYYSQEGLCLELCWLGDDVHLLCLLYVFIHSYTNKDEILSLVRFFSV
jgi:hypothetical protein